MRVLLTCLLIGCAGPAQAMNWEGHDDWMTELSHARVYEQSVPGASAQQPAAADCRDTVRAAAGNPYEQIPLVPPGCRGLQEERELDR